MAIELGSRMGFGLSKFDVGINVSIFGWIINATMNDKINPQIEESWKSALSEEFEKDYFRQLKNFLVAERQSHLVFPPGKNIFAAFDHTPLPQVKVVILGQDPYHGPGQAHGLCFSVPSGIPKPPSLINIFKEISNDLKISMPVSGNLERWADQGVLLLNATLTVRAHMAGSHQKKGWEEFTDSVIRTISEKRDGVVFLLWGAYAQAKESIIDTSRHFVLKAPHPSPLSASRGFFGCGHFSKANELLRKQGLSEIDWRLE
ncbi:MAG TPA: uracil-DNA glycosylase [Williamwhitmania sp.]|nr:uracil-DNA glycosylase [Williamwhitmania sp.]